MTSQTQAGAQKKELKESYDWCRICGSSHSSKDLENNKCKLCIQSDKFRSKSEEAPKIDSELGETKCRLCKRKEENKVLKGNMGYCTKCLFISPELLGNKS